MGKQNQYYCLVCRVCCTRGIRTYGVHILVLSSVLKIQVTYPGNFFQCGRYEWVRYLPQLGHFCWYESRLLLALYIAWDTSVWRDWLGKSRGEVHRTYCGTCNFHKFPDVLTSHTHPTAPYTFYTQTNARMSYLVSRVGAKFEGTWRISTRL